MTGDVFQMAAYRANPALMIPPEKLAGGAPRDTESGQYL